ncbi:MAG: MFS transporter [Opitutaceae bacterium]|nr:MFS transporter [Opitutaceae bacterium]
MRPLHYYLFGTGSWFLAFGIQSVVFAWLVTMVLRESAEMVGFAQMALLLPGTLLILIGGSVADRFGGRRLVIVSQLVASLAPVILICAIWTEQFSYSYLLAYAAVMGSAQAFVTPARDGLLNEVAGGRVQHMVLKTSIAQFGMQAVGLTVASFADSQGPILVLATQSLVMLLGGLAFFGIPKPTFVSAQRHSSTLVGSVLDGARTVMGSPPIRAVALQNVAMAFFFLGSYIVTMPLLVREVFAGSAVDLAYMNGLNSAGLVATIIILLRVGDIRRPGRALLLSQFAGSVVLGLCGLTNAFWLLCSIMFSWGLCGGIALTMSRTIMQVKAPPEQRSRVMSFYSFSFMGAGPIGALLAGFLSERYGPQSALMIAALANFIVILIVGLTSSLWQVSDHPNPEEGIV